MSAPRPPRHPLAVSAVGTAGADDTTRAGAEPRPRCSPHCLRESHPRSTPAGASVLSLSSTLAGSYAPGWRSCGLAAPPALPRPQPLALLPPRPSLRSSPLDCTLSTESAAVCTLTSPIRSRLPLSSSTGMPWAVGRRTGAGWEGLKRRRRSNLRRRRERTVKALGRRASCCEGSS